MENGAKYLRLSVMLKIVDAYRRKIEKHDCGEKDDHEFFFNVRCGFPQSRHCAVVSREFQDAKNTEQAKNADGSEISAE